jgi:hypothetical protein
MSNPNQRTHSGKKKITFGSTRRRVNNSTNPNQPKIFRLLERRKKEPEILVKKAAVGKGESENSDRKRRNES